LKLQVYILRQLVQAFLFAVAGVLFLALPGLAVSAVHKLPNMDAAVLARYLPTVLQTLAPYVLPLCFLLAVVATYGRLAADREWTAIQMAGVRPAWTLVPAGALALVLGGVTYDLVTDKVPVLKRKQRALLYQAANSALQNLQPGLTTLHFHDFFLSARWRDPQNPDVWREVYIRKPSEEGAGMVDLFADRAHIRSVGGQFLVDLEDVRSLAPGRGLELSLGSVRLSTPIADLIGPEKVRSRHVRHYTNAELDELRRGASLDPDQLHQIRFELQYRWAQAAIFLVFAGLGAATGLILRRGTQLGALASSTGYGIVYYVLSMRLGREFGNSGAVPAWFGVWGTPVLGSVVAVWLLRKALRR
jgi:lipopolysaccharide export LptBFGC system permease protein LptF